ncbi:unnamed protein product [Phytophthora lilii]|uniref:Unnamed protein product n=1 Tax=Phytophthora lilii TaxID=2077276 RepID=A0A9W6X396_9STRA|nr:unnamed protein product [Phytophthora lilii]
MGTDETTFNNILVLSPAEHVRSINRAYVTKYDTDLVGAINTEFSGDAKRARGSLASRAEVTHERPSFHVPIYMAIGNVNGHLSLLEFIRARDGFKSTQSSVLQLGFGRMHIRSSLQPQSNRFKF